MMMPVRMPPVVVVMMVMMVVMVVMMMGGKLSDNHRLFVAGSISERALVLGS